MADIWFRPVKRLVVALACVAALVAAPAFAGGGISRPHDLKVEAGAEVARATLGAYCVNERRPGEYASECSDGGYPLAVRESLPVRGGQRLLLRLHDRKVSVALVTLLRVEGHQIKEFETRIARLKGGRATFRLPARLRGANVLDVFLRYEDQMGNADFWVGLESTE